MGRRIIHIWISLFLISGLFSISPCSAKSPDFSINPEMQKKVRQLQEDSKVNIDDFHACQITTTIKEIDNRTSYLYYTPKEITFFYEGQEIIRLINRRGEQGKEALEGLGLNCLEFNKNVYVFLDAVQPESQRRFRLPHYSYVVFSNDNGQTWSGLQSLEQVSLKGNFAIPQRDFHRNVTILGDQDGHAFSIYNKRDETTYLLDPQFNKLRSVPIYNRLTNLNKPVDFYFFQGNIFSIRGSCQRRAGHIVCPDVSYLDQSEDYGRNWKSTALPFMVHSIFKAFDDQLFLFYLSPRRSKWYNFVPGWDRSPIAGQLRMRYLMDNGQWSEEKVLSKTVSSLKDVYLDEIPIIVWEDTRHHRSKWCGYIPFIGCMEPNPFYGPQVIYAGYFDPKTLSIQNETIIEIFKNTSK